ncbi:hypothetical protein CL644_00950 [bacterium]|nr:hypothetical protein [Parcubacteria group bacterium]MBF05259.1 hypothetical protein [bacterium]|tara:strand:- start:2318 stop:2980 length:663 start_codon:yes stop_codon:yes gene_type:complete
MKKTEQDKARKLRLEGHSINEIVKALHVSKSSVSIWVRDIVLTSEQKQKLTKKGHSFEIIEKRRKTRLLNASTERKKDIDRAIRDITHISDENLKYLGIGLYWGEGAKTNRSRVEFYNSDPRLIKIMMIFFKRICKVPKEKFREHTFLHPHLDAKAAENYWSNISKIPLSQFQKTTQVHNAVSKNKKDSLPYGTFTIGVYDTKLFLRIMGWIEGVHQQYK